ncbi:MAG: NAD(P)H:quinone oxidoreductase chain 5 [Candidatus Scalindua brodae]|uniref:NAD(P)H:quinone oxidoreductase chain 5 n=1 Tax=Candidatus Scalindua brodae TaxID=237368 RepID=A0A0B0EF31_9BACT|nr:MAG: NAD(P)H:quinone oxidoreductase chain 5 [Candidatus Scalindua brodae]
MGIITSILSGFALAFIAPVLYRFGRGATGWIVAMLPLGLAAYFSSLIPQVCSGEVITESFRWIPSLGINLSFYLDGLSLLFALLISSIGALILIYAGRYLSGHPCLGRFYLYILMFMASMLGVVLADNLITLFVFWELTSLSSYFLIGFEHDRHESRAAALQALLVTGIGGLALLAGFILLGQTGESLELSNLLNSGDAIRNHQLYTPILLLVLAGAFTKSAQVPFHFWLPSAMEAPTPVSAYLHSATMVKAGIYLLARLSPVLGGTDLWLYSLTTAGAATMVVGAYMAIQQSNLKLILAYSTVSVLGILTMLLGLGTELAIKAAMVFLVGHVLYKAALFLVAGAVDHETGTRDVNRLGGLWRAMPITAIAAGLAALSMSGLPPFFGFIGKELFYEAGLTVQSAAHLLTGVSMLTGMLLFVAAGMAGIRPFIGRQYILHKKPHEPPVSLWLGPVLLAGSGLACGVAPGLVDTSLVAPAVSAIIGHPVPVKLALWHGLNPALVIGTITVAGGLGLFAVRSRLIKVLSPLSNVVVLSPTYLYKRSLDGLMAIASLQARIIQSGYQRYYLLIIFTVTAALVLYTLISLGGLHGPVNLSNIQFYEAGLAALILMGALLSILTNSRFTAVAALGVVGYSVALIYIIYGAPDLATTQILIETLTVILFVLVVYHLPIFSKFSSVAARIRDALISLFAGGTMTALVLKATNVQFHPTISSYFAENSVPLAHGRNIVNVILVDFRALIHWGKLLYLLLPALVFMHCLS